MPARKATARWEGDQKGRGTMSFGSGAFDGQYSFSSRFEEGTGTNPEELISAAHAGCFSMAFAFALADAGHEAESVDTQATVHIDRQGDGFAITRSELVTRARVPGIDESQFQEIAQAAKEGCPVSKALGGVEITVDATLES